MAKKAKRFQEGGFTKEQEEWLGGADRTDPYILARMRKAVPDAPQAASKAETKITTETMLQEAQKIMLGKQTHKAGGTLKKPLGLASGTNMRD
jgi:hypothetical protein